MANQQYDVSKKFKRLFDEKQKIREAIRNAVLKRESNPYLTPSVMYDPAVIKYHAMLTYRSEHLRPTPRNVIAFCGFVVIPVIATFISLYSHHKNKEKILRSGKLTYEERYRMACL